MTFHIREAREQAGLSQRELAARIGVAANTLHGYETGKHDPKSAHLAKIASACAVTVDFLLGLPQPDGPDPEALALARRVGALDPRGRGAVAAVLAYEEAQQSPGAVIPFPTRKMKRFLNRATAGPGSYLFDDGYEEVDVPQDTPGDFLVTISGDSMEPYIRDGQDVSVSMGASLQPGDVGIFLYDGSTYCKQYAASYGYVDLFSLNRARADCDLVIDTRTDLPVTCFGKVCLPKRPPLPK